jgi:hypothetical protein
MSCPPHRFVMDKPDGSPNLSGRCRCGATKTWPASLEAQSAYALKRRIGTEKSRRKA